MCCKVILYLWLVYSGYMFLDRHVWRGGLHDALVGRPLSVLRGYIHEKTRPRPDVAPVAPTEKIAENVAPRVRYVWTSAITSDDPPDPQTKESPPAPPEPPAKEPLAAEQLPVQEAPTPASLPDDDILDDEDEEMMSRTAAYNEGTQPGEVDALDLMTLLRVFSKRRDATKGEIETARRAMRDISGTEIERTILDQLSGRDGYVGAMLDTILTGEAGDDVPPTPLQSPPPDFRLDDYV